MIFSQTKLGYIPVNVTGLTDEDITANQLTKTQTQVESTDYLLTDLQAIEIRTSLPCEAEIDGASNLSTRPLLMSILVDAFSKEGYLYNSPNHDRRYRLTTSGQLNEFNVSSRKISYLEHFIISYLLDKKN